MTTALVTLSQSRPLVVVLDDLHSADPSSLRLLEFVAQHAWFERLLLIGTYRDVEVEGTGHPLQPLILPLVSRATATLTLTGLGRDEVGALMAVTTGREPAPELVDEVHRRTGGNPFFVEQTARLWHSGSPVSTIPPGVREAVRQRLALLPEPVVALLTSAALLGREFRRQVLAVVHGAPVPHVDRLLESAVVARVLVPDPPDSSPSPTTCCARRCTPRWTTPRPATATPPPYGPWTRTAASATRCGPAPSPGTPTSPAGRWSPAGGSTCCWRPPATPRDAWPTKRPSATTAAPSPSPPAPPTPPRARGGNRTCGGPRSSASTSPGSSGTWGSGPRRDGCWTKWSPVRESWTNRSCWPGWRSPSTATGS